MCLRVGSSLLPLAVVAQWIRYWDAESKDAGAGSIPGRGGYFSDSGEKRKTPVSRFRRIVKTPGGRN